MHRLLLGLLVFVLAAAESYVMSKERQTERRLLAVQSAHWAAAFELLLCVWVFVSVEDRALVFAAVPGAWLGQWFPVMRRRKRLRAKQRREKAE